MENLSEHLRSMEDLHHCHHLDLHASIAAIQRGKKDSKSTLCARHCANLRVLNLVLVAFFSVLDTNHPEQYSCIIQSPPFCILLHNLVVQNFRHCEVLLQ